MMTGEDPASLDIDHINRNTSDNRWENLRLATRSENKFNNGGYKRSKSGVKGVTFDKSRSAWRVYRRCDGKNKFLGTFQTEAEAIAVSRAWDVR